MPQWDRKCLTLTCLQANSASGRPQSWHNAKLAWREQQEGHHLPRGYWPAQTWLPGCWKQMSRRQLQSQVWRFRFGASYSRSPVKAERLGEFLKSRSSQLCMELGSCLWWNKRETSRKTKRRPCYQSQSGNKEWKSFEGGVGIIQLTQRPCKSMSGKKPLLWQYINYTIHSCSKKDTQSHK